MTVAYPSTAASYFHLLRRQAYARPRTPLVVFTPKSMLRSKAAASPVEAFTQGGFQPVLADHEGVTKDVTRVLFASGKSELDADAAKAVASAIDLLKSTPNAKIALSGYVDSSGNAEKNAELAKQRAMNVRAALEKAGIAAARIDLQKPVQIQAGSADQSQARRVDIRVAG